MLRLLLRSAGMLLRRRSHSGPLLLLGVTACVLYQVLVVARNRLRSEVGSRKPAEEVLMEARRFVCGLEAQWRHAQVSLPEPQVLAVKLIIFTMESGSEVLNLKPLYQSPFKNLRILTSSTFRLFTSIRTSSATRVHSQTARFKVCNC